MNELYVIMHGDRERPKALHIAFRRNCDDGLSCFTKGKVPRTVRNHKIHTKIIYIGFY